MRKLLSLVHEGMGCDYHRIHVPALFFTDFERGTVEDTDILFFSRYTDFVNVENLKKEGVKLVMDLDDYWILPKTHPHYKIHAKSFAKNIIKNLKIADGVITTNEYLAQHIRKHNKKVIVIPNAIPYGRLQFVRQKGSRKHTLYAGGSSHYEDLKLLKNVQIPSFVLVGEEIEPEFQKMKQLFPYAKCVEAQPLDSYMSLYKDAKLSIAPLVNDEFNKCKSNLKLHEAALYELPVIASDVRPYQENNPPILKARNTLDWTKHFNSKISQNLGKELLEWSKEFYNFDKINKLRQDFILNIK